MDENTIMTLAVMAKLHTELYWLRDGFIAISSPARNDPRVQIDHQHMQDISPLKDWTLNIDRETEQLPYQHEVMIYGVTFFTITNDPIEAH